MAVIFRMCFTRCIRRVCTKRQGFGLMFLMLVLHLMHFVNAVPQKSQMCSLPASAFTMPGSARTMLPALGPQQPVNGPICGPGSCCAPSWEHQLTSDHRNTTERYLRDAIARTAAILETRGQRVDELFRGMMNTSKHDFHSMFVKTYGIIYIQNQDVFQDMYKSLEIYYAKGTVQLTNMMDHFFSVLYQRMFKVINGEFEYDDKYLDCVADNMAALKPFDDVPHKLGQQLKRSFVATRVFYKALIEGGKVAGEMLQLDLPVEECGARLTKMHHCGRCLYGEDGAKACFGFCREAYTGCLRDYMELGADWDKYVDAIDKVADRLIGPFNIEMVVQPIDIKISEAIMNFQENREDITTKVFSVCGKPTVKRRRRNAKFEDKDGEDSKEIRLKKIKFQGKRKHKKTNNRQQEVTMDGFEKEIYEIKTKIKELRQFWSHLPYQLCNHNNGGTVAPPTPNQGCWTGEGVANPGAAATAGTTPPSGIHSQSQASFTPTTSATSRSLVQKQAGVLQMLTGRLKDAYNGHDVSYDEEEVVTAVEDGSGDGGSGHRPLIDSDTEDGDDDDDNIDLNLNLHNQDGRGSGDHQPQPQPQPPSYIPPDTEDISTHTQTTSTPHPPPVPPPSETPNLKPDVDEPTAVLTTTSDRPSVILASRSNGAQSWEVRRAVLQYVMPIVAVWFGNAVGSLL